MEIVLNHVTDLGNCIDIRLCMFTENENNYFEKLLGLTKESGRYLVIHARKEKSVDGSYPYSAFIKGSIYDMDGEVCIVPKEIFREDDMHEINHWIDEHEKEWINAID